MHIQQFIPIESCFKSGQTDAIESLCDRVMTQRANVIGREGQGSVRRNTVRRCQSGWLHSNESTRWLFDEIWNLVREVNSRSFQFEINEMEALQYLEYGPLNFFRWHTDNGDDAVANRKLTAIVQLSDPGNYVGGKLQIKAQHPKSAPPNARGSVTIFPSHLLHRATPVWWGTRKVLVAWIRGNRPLR